MKPKTYAQDDRCQYCVMLSTIFGDCDLHILPCDRDHGLLPERQSRYIIENWARMVPMSEERMTYRHQQTANEVIGEAQIELFEVALRLAVRERIRESLGV